MFVLYFQIVVWIPYGYRNATEPNQYNTLIMQSPQRKPRV